MDLLQSEKPQIGVNTFDLLTFRWRLDEILNMKINLLVRWKKKKKKGECFGCMSFPQDILINSSLIAGCLNFTITSLLVLHILFREAQLSAIESREGAAL